MQGDKIHFSSNRMDWETPQNLFNYLDRAFHFTLDVAANHQNAKCARYFTEEDDGLAQSWAGEVCWMNPPYGRDVVQWIRKAKEESKRGATVVALVFARVDTQWFHDYCLESEVIFIKGRLRFGGADNSAPFPSMLVIFRSEDSAQRVKTLDSKKVA